MLLADHYARWRDPAVIKERALFPAHRHPTELEIQARWFAGEFGSDFTSTTGEKIELVQSGSWNREAGPDFRDAAIRINGGPPRTGCIELDLTDRSWEQHGHSINPDFENTVLHVFVEQGERAFFTRTLSAGAIRPLFGAIKRSSGRAIAHRPARRGTISPAQESRAPAGNDGPPRPR